MALIRAAQDVARKRAAIDKLHVLLYPKSLSPANVRKLRQDDAGVIWL